MLDHRDPAALRRQVQVALSHVREVDLLVGLVRRRDHAAGVGIGSENAAAFLHHPALELAVHLPLPGLGGVVDDLEGNVDLVAVAIKDVALDDAHAVGAHPGQRHHQSILPLLQHIAARRRAEALMVIGRSLFADETGLG